MMKRPTERGGTVKSLRQAMSLIKMGAPMHPIFVHFTIALTASSLVFDALGSATVPSTLMLPALLEPPPPAKTDRSIGPMACGVISCWPCC